MATIYIERRNSRAANWSRRLGYFALVLLLVASLGHRYGFVETPAFLNVAGVVTALSLVALACAAWGFSRLWQRGDKAGRSAVAGTVMALAALSPAISAGVSYLYFPALNDISTDPADPPALPLAARERDASMNPITPPTPEQIAEQTRAYPEITGRRFEATIDHMLDVVVAEAQRRGWTIRNASTPVEDVQEATVEMVVYTPLLAFAGDAAVRLSEQDDGTLVDMRLVSRYGRSDLGNNARQISSFLSAIDQTLKGEAGE